MKNCPVCNIPLNEISLESESADICPQCGGIWFDRDEMQRAVNSLLSKGQVEERDLREMLSQKRSDVSESGSFSRKCPVCATDMEIINYCYDSNIFLDRCPSCGGIWTDQGELSRIARHRRGNKKMDKLGNALSQAHMESVRMKAVNGNLSTLNEKVSFTQLLMLWFSFFPLPLFDDCKRRSFPFVTLGLILLNGIIFYVQATVHSAETLNDYFMAVGFVPGLGFAVKRILTLFSCLFVHVNFFHFAGNMYYLWLFGDNVEDAFGHIRFLFFYLLAGVFSTLVFALTNMSGMLPLIGASGAISGVIGAYVLFFPDAVLEVLWLGRPRELQAFHYIGAWIGMQLLFGTLALRCPNCAGVAYWAHIGGFFFGMGCAYLLNLIQSFREEQ